jgi:hypothetical protein
MGRVVIRAIRAFVDGGGPTCLWALCSVLYRALQHAGLSRFSHWAQLLLRAGAGDAVDFGRGNAAAAVEMD